MSSKSLKVEGYIAHADMLFHRRQADGECFKLTFDEAEGGDFADFLSSRLPRQERDIIPYREASVAHGVILPASVSADCTELEYLAWLEPPEAPDENRAGRHKYAIDDAWQYCEENDLDFDGSSLLTMYTTFRDAKAYIYTSVWLKSQDIATSTQGIEAMERLSVRSGATICIRGLKNQIITVRNGQSAQF